MAFYKNLRKCVRNMSSESNNMPSTNNGILVNFKVPYINELIAGWKDRLAIDIGDSLIM